MTNQNNHHHNHHHNIINTVTSSSSNNKINNNNSSSSSSAEEEEEHHSKHKHTKLDKNNNGYYYAFITFFKSLFGAGLLSLPNALGRVGIPLGIIIYGLVGIGCTFSCYLLLEARKQTIQTQRKRRKNLLYHHGKDHLPNQHHQQQQQHHHHHHRIITYGDLADILLGHTMASITRWTIIVLNILFTAGLAIVICENLGELLLSLYGNNDREEQEQQQEYYFYYRQIVGLCLLPVVILLLQIPWLQDMWFISVMGLIVYTVGVIGSTLFSAIWTIIHLTTTTTTTTTSAAAITMVVDNEEETMIVENQQRGMPDDIWSINWNGIPSFVGTAVYALEGINLALPTAHSMMMEINNNNNNTDYAKAKATHVVCTGVLWYAFITIVFAVIGYAGGLGGGSGTGLTPTQCDVVTNCITPPFLKHTIQITLSIAMTLSIPVMLYPSTEMLEVMLTDAKQQRRQQQYHHQQKQKHRDHTDDEVSLVELEPLAHHRHPHHHNHVSNEEMIPKTASDFESSLVVRLPTPNNNNNTYGSTTSSVVTKDNNSSSVGGGLEFPDLTRQQHQHQQHHQQQHKHHGQNDNDDIEVEEEPSFSQEKNWKLRIILAILTVTMGAVTKSFTFYSELIGAVGLSFAGFVLPPLLYLRAMEQAQVPISLMMKLTMLSLAIFGFYNMLAGGLSSLKDLFES